MPTISDTEVNSILEISALAVECVDEDHFPPALMREMTELFGSKSCVFYSMSGYNVPTISDTEVNKTWTGIRSGTASATTSARHGSRTTRPTIGPSIPALPGSGAARRQNALWWFPPTR